MLIKPIPQYAHAEFAEALNNAGYITKLSEFDVDLNDMYAFLGVDQRDGKFVFVVAMTNEEAPEGIEDPHYISKLYVEMNALGVVVAEWGAMPDHDSLTRDEVVAYFNGVKDVRRYIQ